MQDISQTNKPHRGPAKGKSAADAKPDLRGSNPKAFVSQSGAKAAKQQRRKVELDQKKLHVPAVDRTFGGAQPGQGSKSSTVGLAHEDGQGPPPVIVAVIGPPGVGKSTLIRSLVRRFTKTTMPEIQGPVTVVSGKGRRLTFIECPNDVGAMVDVAKIADLVLLLVDGSFGFEMETFEALSALNSHGLPKIIAILTHLDLIKKAAALKAQKKRLKHRFWTEVYDGAKMFYLSGVMNGRYPDREILNLSRFINVAKFRPLQFRNTHPYFLADRLEDLTPREDVRQNPKMDRSVALYGYLRGVPLRPPSAVNSIHVHIPGSGVDAFEATKLTALTDPCPLPTQESEKRRRMGEKDRKYHAPMSGGAGGQVVFDGDRVWINTAGTFTKKHDEDGNEIPTGEGEQMVMSLQDAEGALGDNIAQSDIRLFGQSAAPIRVGSSKDLQQDGEDEDGEDDAESDGEDPSQDDDDEGDGDLDADLSLGAAAGSTAGRRGALRSAPSAQEPQGEDVAFAESDSDLGLDDSDQEDLDLDGGNDEEGLHDEENEEGDSDEEEDEAAPAWKRNLSQRAADSFAQTARQRQHRSWTRCIYDSALSPSQVVNGIDEPAGPPKTSQDNEEDEDDLFQLARRPDDALLAEDHFRPIASTSAQPLSLEEEEVLDKFRKFFITGANDSAPADHRYEDKDGGFEDLERDSDEEEGSSADESEDEEPGKQPESEETKAQKLADKKEMLKRKFNSQYDDEDDEEKKDFFTEQKEEMIQRLEATRKEFQGDDVETRALVEGYRPGAYVRLEIQSVPCELIEKFDPHFPLVVGGLLPHEQSFGFVQVRIKKHRWHHRVLKTNDPLIFSMGWRRFQSTPVYSMDDNSHNRMLKYSPEHMHCLATFYGPISAPNSGFCAFNTISNSNNASSFKVTATGTVLDVDGSSQIVKKLKLTGTPYKIFKNTAFIKEMFNSALEVAKFEGAQIRTVSGIRGQIKKALSKPEGSFRATFEDRILASDLVFLRTWHQVQPRKYYYPVSSLLMYDKAQWAGMRLTGQVRIEDNIKTPNPANSQYKPIERQTRRFNTLKVPRKLQADLPYASKPKMQKPRKEATYMSKRAVVLEPKEKRALGLLQQIQAVQHNKEAKRKDKQAERRAEKAKKMSKGEELKEDREKRERKEHFRKAGMDTKRKAESASRPSKKQKRGDD